MVQFKIVEITNLDGFLLEFEKVPYYSKISRWLKKHEEVSG